jgi:hypothetical protein|tara:strand:+ start:1793 stop:1945 length:153 start_codon:yes stop_codon:yes gene_type:complete
MYAYLMGKKRVPEPEPEREPTPEPEPEPVPAKPCKFGYVLMAVMGLILKI